MRVAIVTIISENYGNRLQNYALQQTLTKMGCNVHTLFPETEIQPKVFIKNIIKGLINIVNRNRYPYIQRKKNFDKFNKKHILKKIYRQNKNIIHKYDYFVCGSDQVWNITFPFITDFHFAVFAPKTKKIAYSASFGISEIPKDKKEQCASWINDFKSVSVRETRGSEIVKELTGRDVPVLVDPTMLLSCDEWLELVKVEQIKRKEHVFAYFLGNISEDAQKLIAYMQDDFGMDVQYFSDNSPKSPEEFIGSINSSSLVITDSFHACVFSIIARVPFVVCDRSDHNSPMNSRIDTLMEMFDIKDRNLKEIDYANVLNIDYSCVDYVLEREQKRAIEYLKQSLGLENEN